MPFAAHKFLKNGLKKHYLYKNWHSLKTIKTCFFSHKLCVNSLFMLVFLFERVGFI